VNQSSSLKDCEKAFAGWGWVFHITKTVLTVDTTADFCIISDQGSGRDSLMSNHLFSKSGERWLRPNKEGCDEGNIKSWPTFVCYKTSLREEGKGR